VDRQTGTTRQDATVRLGTGSHPHAWTITAGGRDYDALALARKAVEDWTTFLKAQGLLSGNP
jgi:hypothetical protein